MNKILIGKLQGIVMKFGFYKWLFISIVCCSSIFTYDIVKLSKRQECDVELLLNGGFHPLTGFMNQQDYNSVVENMRLANGTVWPIPIVLDLSFEQVKEIFKGATLQLQASDNTILAQLTVEDIWRPNKIQEAKFVYGTTDRAHPGVNYLFNHVKDYYIGGTITLVNTPKHYDFTHLRKTPTELKQYFKKHNIKHVVAFQTRNPLHRAHFELTSRALEKVGYLLVHPSVGQTKPGDVDHFTRVKCYQHLMNYYPLEKAQLSLLPLAMRMAGPREALWHAIIRKNYGATHFIIGRDHAGPGSDNNGTPFYGLYDAQKLVQQYADEIGITVVTFEEMVYASNKNKYIPKNEVHQSDNIATISGTQFRKMLKEGIEIPKWFSFPEIIEELQKKYPPKNKQGITIFLTGLSGAGKTTIAQALATKLAELQQRPISILDGDNIRQLISSELGFSKEHRSLNVRRVGFIAHEITKNRGIAICPLIAPYAQDRQFNRHMISNYGNYIEIYVSTPLNICQARDPKGLYKLALQGKITQFTGISDPYEAPVNAELVIDTSHTTIEEAIDSIITYLKQEHYI